jgi:glycosyltransferase involved in cell wall biosynthesis
VDVLCGTEQYAPLPPGSATPDPRAFGVRIMRVPRILPGPVRRLRALRIVWFCVCAVPMLLLRRRLGAIVTLTNPPLIVPAVAFAAALRRVPFIVITQDLYPEVLFASGALSPASLAGRCLSRLFSWAFRRAWRVVVLGPFMQRRVQAKGVSGARIVSISNWATGEIERQIGTDNPLRSQWGLQQRFVVLYSGNLGVGHEFETFLRGVRTAAETVANLTVVFVGDGSRAAEVREQSCALGLADRVVFRAFVPAEQLPLSMGLADLALVTLRTGFEGTIVPSKLLGYMARGIPTIYVGPDSDVAQMIRAADCGVCCAPGESARVAESLCAAARDAALRQRWASNARGFYALHYTRELALDHYIGLARAALAHSG